MICFEYLNKPEFPAVANKIFDILADNMGKIAPTGNTRAEDFRCWYEAVADGLKKEQRQIVLIKDEEDIIGFFQYYTNENTFMMEEIQFKPEYQGTKVFRNLFGFLIENIGENPEFTEAYANTENLKSTGILRHLGLSEVGMNKNGRSFHFRGRYRDLVKWYKESSEK